MSAAELRRALQDARARTIRVREALADGDEELAELILDDLEADLDGVLADRDVRDLADEDELAL